MTTRTIATLIVFALAGGLMAGTVFDRSIPPIIAAGFGLVLGFLFAVTTEQKN